MMIENISLRGIVSLSHAILKVANIAHIVLQPHPQTYPTQLQPQLVAYLLFQLFFIIPVFFYYSGDILYAKEILFSMNYDLQ